MTKPHLAAVFFDAAGTLLTLRESVGSGYAAMAERFGFSLDATAAEAEFRIQLRAVAPPSGGCPPADDGAGWWQALVFRLLDALGRSDLPGELRQAYFEALYAHYSDPAQWVLYPEVPGVIDTLRRDHPDLFIGVVSNFDKRLRPILEGLGLLPVFDDIVISTEIGYSKPDRGIFEAACRRSDRACETCLHVGDDPREDWAGAHRAGLRVLELKRPDSDLTCVLDLFS